MNIKFILSVIFTLGINLLCLSAPPPPSGTPACWPPPCIPIDGGISFLIAAGALYGAKTLHDKHKQKGKRII